MRRIAAVVAIIMVLSVATVAGLWQQYQRFLQTPLNIGDSSALVLRVERGSSIRSVVEDLDSMGVTRFGWQWRLLNRLEPATIQAGEYTLKAGLLPPELIKLLVSGKVVGYRFTIVEGWTVQQLLTSLANDSVLEHSIFGLEELEGLDGLPQGHKEGWFLPETYVYVRGDSDLDILQRAHRDMQEALDDAWTGRALSLPYETDYELLIMASIIEKETSLDSERSTIAGVFVRRLLKKWRLETDPTVIYGMGEAYDGNIRRRDLKTDTPYNTYTRHGLPPTPIALPGRASLQAAAHPEAGDAMFFVADGKGGHTFSATLEAHNKAIQQLLKGNADQPD
jgi:UPF0755 protein